MKVTEQEDLQEPALLQTGKKNAFFLEIILLNRLF